MDEKRGNIFMWVITVYSNSNNTTIFEFENETEARKAF